MGVQRMIMLLLARPYTSAAKCDKPTRSLIIAKFQIEYKPP